MQKTAKKDYSFVSSCSYIIRAAFRVVYTVIITDSHKNAKSFSFAAKSNCFGGLSTFCFVAFIAGFCAYGSLSSPDGRFFLCFAKERNQRKAT
jgi:hypothetical protein